MDFVSNGRPLVKARLGGTNVLVYVHAGDAFESVVRLSAHRERQPPLGDLLADLEPRVERGVERSS